MTTVDPQASRSWRLAGPESGTHVEVDRRESDGTWHVTYQGIVWATGDSLRNALSDACGVNRADAWVVETETTIIARIAASR